MVLLNDPASRAILINAEITITLNTKFQLSLVNKSVVEEKVKEVPQLHEAPEGEA